jgi:hypothetical protein
VTTTDRLEPTFIIAPTLHNCPPEGATLDWRVGAMMKVGSRRSVVVTERK